MRERCSVVRWMHADGAAIFAVDALPAQRTTVAVRAEAREPSTITTARPDHHERAGRAANRIVGQVDLESVLGEFALGAEGGCTLTLASAPAPSIASTKNNR